MSDISVVSLDGPTISVVSERALEVHVVEATVGLQGPAGVDGSDGVDGLGVAAVEAIAQVEAEELRLDMDALVAATLSI